LALIALAAAQPALVQADSIWARRDPKSAYLFVDTRARQIGDVLNILIREHTDLDFKDRRDLERDTTGSATFSYSGKSGSSNGSRTGNASMTLEADSTRTAQSKAEYKSDRRYFDRVSVVVIDVMPNGNLVIEGLKRLHIAGEEKTIRVSGIVRPADINGENGVDSALIANLQLLYTGRGQESSYINNGWLGKIMNHLWPF
jgi:flagellar L-ring protein precursor FlgH